MTFIGGGGNYSTPKTPQTLHPQSRNSTIETIAIPMAATSIITTQVPPVHKPVSITNMLSPGPTLWVVTTRGYIKPYSQVPLANAPQLLNQPHHPPTTPPPLRCHSATKEQFHTAPGSWGFGPHAAAYQRANNIPSFQPGTSMMANSMEFSNGFNYLGTMPAPPAYSQPNPGQSFYQNHFSRSGAVDGIHKLNTDLLQQVWCKPMWGKNL
jgi:hypothetical protein